jgi:hypothetical protein
MSQAEVDSGRGASFSTAARAAVEALLAPADAEPTRRYPGEPGTRQPVHTVYVPADAFDAGTVRNWGREALLAFDTHAATPAELAAAPGPPAGLLRRRVRVLCREGLAAARARLAAYVA